MKTNVGKLTEALVTQPVVICRKGGTVKSRIISFICVFMIIFVMSLPAYSDIGILDTTTINFSASGSPNTIAGSWSASPLSISDGLIIDYFTVEITEMNSDFGNPSSISFDSHFPGNSRSLSFCSNPNSCVANALVGDVGYIDSASSVLFAWDFMNRLVSGSSPMITSGSSTVSYSSGGDSASISGNVLVHAYGDMPVIPEPVSSSLFLVGASVLGFRRFRKK